MGVNHKLGTLVRADDLDLQNNFRHGLRFCCRHKDQTAYDKSFLRGTDPGNSHCHVYFTVNATHMKDGSVAHRNWQQPGFLSYLQKQLQGLGEGGYKGT